MGVKIFNSSSSEDWTVPVGVTALTTLEATGPGEDGDGPVITPGAGGTNTDNLNHGGDGTLNGVGNAGLGPSSFLFGDSDNNYTVGVVEYGAGELSNTSVEIWGGGGHGKLAGGGGGGYINLEMTVAPACTKTVVADGSTTFVVHRGGGDLTFRANRGADAVGNTPGAGGTTFVSSDPDGYVNLAQDGTAGTAETFEGGDGGAGGNFGRVVAVAVVAGKVVRVTRSSTYTEARYDPTGANTKLLKSGNLFDDITSDLAINLQSNGGTAGAASGALGGGGGDPGTAAGAGNDGASDVTADEDDGADGTSPGDAGDGAGGHGTNGGNGFLGFAILTYVAPGTAVPPHTQLNTGIGIGM